MIQARGVSLAEYEKSRKNSTYDNSSRLAKSKANQQLIIQTAVKLLVERRGGEFRFDEIAALTGLAERSIYRFFKNKEELYKEIERYLAVYLEAGNQQLATLSVVSFASNAYSLFDQNESLVLAYIYSPLGEETRRIFRKRLNQLLISKIEVEKGIKLNSEQIKRVALIVSLINAKVWHDIRSDFGFSGAEMKDPLEWAFNILISSL